MRGLVTPHVPDAFEQRPPMELVAGGLHRMLDEALLHAYVSGSVGGIQEEQDDYFVYEVSVRIRRKEKDGHLYVDGKPVMVNMLSGGAGLRPRFQSLARHPTHADLLQALSTLSGVVAALRVERGVGAGKDMLEEAEALLERLGVPRGVVLRTARNNDE